MSQKIFLTSALAMGVIAPAFAEPSHTGTFPADGYMEEDYTYTNAATADNMDSVYEGTVDAVAEYEDVLFQFRRKSSGGRRISRRSHARLDRVAFALRKHYESRFLKAGRRLQP